MSLDTWSRPLTVRPQVPTHPLWVSGTSICKKRLESVLQLCRLVLQQRPLTASDSLTQELDTSSRNRGVAARAGVSPRGRRARTTCRPLQTPVHPSPWL